MTEEEFQTLEELVAREKNTDLVIADYVEQLLEKSHTLEDVGKANALLVITALRNEKLTEDLERDVKLLAEQVKRFKDALLDREGTIDRLTADNVELAKAENEYPSDHVVDGLKNALRYWKKKATDREKTIERLTEANAELAKTVAVAEAGSEGLLEMAMWEQIGQMKGKHDKFIQRQMVVEERLVGLEAKAEVIRAAYAQLLNQEKVTATPAEDQEEPRSMNWTEGYQYWIDTECRALYTVFVSLQAHEATKASQPMTGDDWSSFWTRKEEMAELPEANQEVTDEELRERIRNAASTGNQAAIEALAHKNQKQEVAEEKLPEAKQWYWDTTREVPVYAHSFTQFSNGVTSAMVSVPIIGRSDHTEESHIITVNVAPEDLIDVPIRAAVEFQL